MRCLSLAAELQARGAQTAFISLELPSDIEDLLREQGHAVHRLPKSVQGNELADALATIEIERNITAYVVDHYKLGRHWESIVTARAPVMALDDLGRSHAAHWLVDQNFSLDSPARYPHKSNEVSEQLLGPSFALMREEFARARHQAQARDSGVRHVLVSFGGMDAGNITSLALEAISQSLPPNIQVTVITGTSHPDLAGLQTWCAGRDNARLHVQVRSMAPYLLAADLAIGAGGSSTWERCACGLPTIAICLAENQRKIISDGARAGFLWGIDHVPSTLELATVLKALFTSPGLVEHMSRQALQITDARGAKRVADRLMPRTVSVRLASAADAQMIYDWRTLPEVMDASGTSQTFSFKDHCAWLEQVLTDPKRLLLVGLEEGREIGVVRFDIEGRHAEVSIFLAPDKAGAGLGSALLKAAETRLRLDHPLVTQVNARIKADNPQSFLLFRRLGYSHLTSQLNKELT